MARATTKVAQFAIEQGAGDRLDAPMADHIPPPPAPAATYAPGAWFALALLTLTYSLSWMDRFCWSS
jgi:hypothetical protein